MRKSKQIDSINKRQTHSHNSIELCRIEERRVVGSIDSALIPALVIVFQIGVSETKQKSCSICLHSHLMIRFVVPLTVSENVYDLVHLVRFQCNKYRGHQTRHPEFHHKWRARH